MPTKKRKKKDLHKKSKWDMKLLQLYVTSEVTTNDSFIDFHVWQISDERTKKDKVVSDVSRPDELY